VIGHFEVLETIGQGGFGTVMKAFDTKLQRVVAVKVMSPELAATSPARKRFLREARAAAAVRHENVVHIYAVEGDPSPHLVMEYVPGGSLQQLLTQSGPLDVEDAVRLGVQVARGLAAAHAHGLVHRDVKPANVLLEPGDQPRAKLTDFGVARAADDASLTQSGVIVGTPMYMAPEQARGEPVDHRADLFSLGSVLYAMVTGRLPFRASNSLAVLKRVSEGAPRPVRDIIPETPAWLCDVIDRLHARDPADRFQSAAEVADLLEQCLAGAAVRVPRAPRSRGRRWPLPAAVLLGGAAAAIALAPFRPAGKSTDETATAPAPPPQPAPRPDPPASPQQFEQAAAGLRHLNPEFRGQIVPTFAGGRLIGLELNDSSTVRDLLPLRDLHDLQTLTAWNTEVADLSPLRGLPLRSLCLNNNFRIRDLSPLAGMPLEQLEVWGFDGADLTPLAGMRLRVLNCGGGWHRLDLSPLKGMPLNFVCINQTRTDDLSPLQGTALDALLIERTAVRDLTPVKGMRLRKVALRGSLVTDLSLLRGMPLAEVTYDFDPARDAGFLRSFPGLNRINERPAEEFWKTAGMR
jgi:serine/threonine protein kinase